MVSLRWRLDLVVFKLLHELVCGVTEHPSPDVVTHRSGAWENKRQRQMRTKEKRGFGNKFHSKAWIYANLRCIPGNRNRPIPGGSEKEECIITLFPWENILGWKKSFEVGFCWAPFPSLYTQQMVILLFYKWVTQKKKVGFTLVRRSK